MRKKILTLIELYQGEPIPRGYGIAYSEFPNMTAVLYPIPFNLIVGIARRIRNWMRYGLSSNHMHDAYSHGYVKGFEDGKQYVRNRMEEELVRWEQS